MIDIIRHRTTALLLCFLGWPGGAAITQTFTAPPAVYSHILHNQKAVAHIRFHALNTP